MQVVTGSPMSGTYTLLQNRHSGRLIVVEGIDGSGKSTQLFLLSQWLRSQGYAVAFSEWNSSPLVRQTTRRGKKKASFTSATFSLIHATDFADRWERQILPMLRAGCLVLCDRSLYTSFARDAVRGCGDAWLRTLYGFCRPPDITFYFRLPLETALQRVMEGRPRLKFFEAGMDLGLSPDLVESFRLFQGLVQEQYERLAGEHGFTVVDATRSIEAQQEEIRAVLADRVDLAAYRRRVTG
jgi:dTMP kinase